MGKCPFVHLASPASLPIRYGLCVLAVDLQYTVKTLAAFSNIQMGQLRSREGCTNKRSHAQQMRLAISQT